MPFLKKKAVKRWFRLCTMTFLQNTVKFQQLHLSSLHFQTLQTSFHPQAECALQECWISHDQDLVAILCLLDVKESGLLDYSENEETLSDRIWISSSIIYRLHIHLARRKICRATWCSDNRVAGSSFITIQSSSEKVTKSQHCNSYMSGQCSSINANCSSQVSVSAAAQTAPCWTFWLPGFTCLLHLTSLHLTPRPPLSSSCLTEQLCVTI